MAPRVSSRRSLAAVALALVLLLLPGGVVARAAPPTADALLRQMANAESRVNYSGIETVSRPTVATVKLKVWRSGASRRLEFLDPPVMRGDLLVDDGNNVWSYRHAENSAVQTRSARNRGGDSIGWAQLSRGFDARVAGQESLAGRRAWVVVLSPRGRSQVVRKLWIDAATGARLRLVHLAAGGQVIEDVAVQTARFGAVAPSLFHWTPPASAHVTRTSGTLYTQLAPARHAAGWVQYPHPAPRGYDFESAVVDPKGEAWLRYTNGVNRFSLFEQRAPSAVDAPLRAVKGGSYWLRGGIRFLLVGVPTGQASAVAASVR